MVTMDMREDHAVDGLRRDILGRQSRAGMAEARAPGRARAGIDEDDLGAATQEETVDRNRRAGARLLRADAGTLGLITDIDEGIRRNFEHSVLQSCHLEHHSASVSSRK
jgi:hypothetical protein